MSFDPITKRSDRSNLEYFEEYATEELGAKQSQLDDSTQVSDEEAQRQAALEQLKENFERAMALRRLQASFERAMELRRQQLQPGSYRYFIRELDKYPDTAPAAMQLDVDTLNQYHSELVAFDLEITRSALLTPDQITELKSLFGQRDGCVTQALTLLVETPDEPPPMPPRSQIRGWERTLNGIEEQRIERLSAATAQEKIQAIDDIIDNLDGYGLYDSEPENLRILRARAGALKSLLQLAIDIDSIPHGDAVAAFDTEGAFTPLLSKCRFLTLKLNALTIDSELDVRNRHKEKLTELLNKYRDALTEGLEALRARIATPPPPPLEPVETPVEQPLPAPEPYPEVLPPENPAPVQQPSAPTVTLPDRDKVRGWDRTLDNINGKKIDELSLAQAQAKLEDVVSLISEYDSFNLGTDATAELTVLRNRAVAFQNLLQLRIDIDAIAHGDDVLELDSVESIAPILSRCRFLMMRINAIAIDDALDIRARHKEKLLTLLNGYQDVLAKRKTAIEQIALAEAAVADLEEKVSAANSSISQIGACTVYREYQRLKAPAQQAYTDATVQLATARAAVQGAEAAFNAVPRSARSDLSVSSISDRFETSDETMSGLSVPTQCARCTDIPVLPSYEQATTVTRERPQMSMVGSGAGPGAASAGSIYEQFDTFLREKVNPIIDEWWNGLTEDNPRYWIRISLNVHYAPDSGCRTCQRGTIHGIIVDQPGGPQFIGEERLAQIRTLVQYLQFSIPENSPDFENGLQTGRDLGINMSSLIARASFPSRGRAVVACSNHPTTERVDHGRMIAELQRLRNSFLGGYANLRLTIDLDANSDGYVTSVKITDEGGANLEQYKDDIEAFATAVALNIRAPEGSRGVRIGPPQEEEDEE